MPPRTSVLEWVRRDRAGFADRYARARDRQLEHWADELIEIADDACNDWMERNGEPVLNGEHVQRSKLRSDNRKWLLSKLKPERYGDRLEHVGAGGKDLIPPGEGLAAAFATALALAFRSTPKPETEGSAETLSVEYYEIIISF